MDFVIQALNDPIVIITIIAWTTPWKGYALWKAARLYHRGWFLAILILNTLAILDIFYIFYIARKTEQEIEDQVLAAESKPSLDKLS